MSWPNLRVGPPSAAFDGNVNVLVGGKLTTSGEAGGAEGTVVTLGDAAFAREVPGTYQVGVTALGSQVSPYAGSDMLVVGGNLAAGPGTHLEVGQSLGADVAVGGGVATGSDLDPHGGRVDQGVANATAPYLALANQLTPKSAFYASLPTTGTVDTTNGAITLIGDGTSQVQVFNLDGGALHPEGEPERSLELRGVPQDATVVVNFTGTAVSLDIDSVLTTDGHPIDPQTDPYFATLATHLLWNAPFATTVDIGGRAQLPGSLLVPDPASTTTLSGAGTNGRILVGGNLVHQGSGELHAYPFLADDQLTCTPDPVHVTTLSLDVELVDPDNVVNPNRFFEGEFACTLDQVDVTPPDHDWKMRAGTEAKVVSDQIPAGAVCSVSQDPPEDPAPFRSWAAPVTAPDVVVVAKRENLGFTITNRVKDKPAPPTQDPSSPSTPTPTPTATPTPTESVPEPPAPPASPTVSSTPTTIVEPTNRPELPGSPSAAPTPGSTTSPTPTEDAETPQADPPNRGSAAGPFSTTAPFTLRGAFVWGPMLMLSLLTLLVRVRRRPKRLH